MKGTLYIVATPIGNLEDITLRGIRILKEVDFVFAEDTRTTGNLFKKYEIQTTLISYNAHNQESKNKEILKLLNEGKSLALVSDAGTPGISDPGYSAVAEVRKYFEKPNIITIPGASALTAFISILGAGSHAWTFYGFLPHKNGRQTMLKEMLASEYSSVFYESTHRIIKCLEELVKLQSTRRVVIGKELTKIYEEIISGTPEEILKIFEANKLKTKGEFVVMIV
jgi:16S rRNA (cytidine1402-2'-O)-methyltransferase